MNILVVSQYFWPENFRINDLVSEFVRRGHKVTILTGVPNYPSGYIFPEYKNAPSNFTEFSGAAIIRVPLITRGRGGAVRLLMNYISFVVSAIFYGGWRLRRKKYDSIFVYEPSPVTVCLPAIFFKKIKRAPIVFWVLDLWPETLMAVGVVKSRILIRLIGLLVSYIYNNCELILAQSHAFIDNISIYCNNPKKIKYFPSWAEDSFSESGIQSATNVPTSLSEEMFTIMFAGNIGEAQDFPSILRAAEILKSNKNIRWLIVGDGRLADWVKNECHSRGLEQNIIMLGRHSLDKMPSFYSQADVLLVSLKDENIFSMTIPGKVQSYLASAKPILGMLNGEGAKIINVSGAGYTCNAGDSDALACIVEKMISLSKVKRDEMGRLGKKYYQDEFEKKVLINRLDIWLNEVEYL